ncbi:hypothetical protein V6N13_104702 [Hibiscus sabdariffa]
MRCVSELLLSAIFSKYLSFLLHGMSIKIKEREGGRSLKKDQTKSSSTESSSRPSLIETTFKTIEEESSALTIPNSFDFEFGHFLLLDFMDSRPDPYHLSNFLLFLIQ